MYPEMGDACLLVSERFTGGLQHPVAARIIAGALSQNGAMTVACYSETIAYDTNESLPQPVAQGVVSKFLLLGGPNPALIQAIQRRGAIAVHLGLDSGSAGTFSLLPDYTEASRLGLEYLFAKGHRKIGIVSGPFGTAEAHHIELNRGVRIACEHYNVPIETLAIFYGDLTAKAGAEALDAATARNAGLTAFFCMSDESAVGLMSLATARGLSIPVKLSIVGCGDDPMAELTHPGLTTVRLPLSEIGSLGVREADAIVRGTAPTGRRKLVPITFIERQSVAAAPELR
jgi:LacI family transcriptional regulator